MLIIQCRLCKKIRDDGKYRHPWPGELPLQIKKTYCPACAQIALQEIQRGEIPVSFQGCKQQAAS